MIPFIIVEGWRNNDSEVMRAVEFRKCKRSDKRMSGVGEDKWTGLGCVRIKERVDPVLPGDRFGLGLVGPSWLAPKYLDGVTFQVG